MAPRTAVSICSGVAGLDLGVQLGSEFLRGEGYRTVLYVERELYAASVLAARMEDGLLDQAPIWSDLFTLGEPEPSDYLRAAVPRGIDLLFGGIPCQPWSVAGKQEGKDDARDLWPPTAAFIEAHRPAGVFIENVSGFAVRDGLGRVADDLGRMGYRVASVMLRASDVGASHGRLRLFILGVLADPHGQRLQERRGSEPTGAQQPGAECGGDDMEHAEIQRRREGRAAQHDHEPASGCPDLADTPSDGRSAGQGIGRLAAGDDAAGELFERAVPCSPLLFAPGPSDARWGDVLREFPWLAPALAVQASPEPDLRGVADGLSAAMDLRSQRLRCVGNGVVDVQAAVAYVLLRLALEASRGGASE